MWFTTCMSWVTQLHVFHWLPWWMLVFFKSLSLVSIVKCCAEHRYKVCLKPYGSRFDAMAWSLDLLYLPRRGEVVGYWLSRVLLLRSVSEKKICWNSNAPDVYLGGSKFKFRLRCWLSLLSFLFVFWGFLLFSVVPPGFLPQPSQFISHLSSSRH
jgi:hypothetical protein